MVLLLPGWASNPRYAFLGALRSAAQMISYEVSLGIILINVVLCTGTLNLSKIVEFQENVWLIFPLLPSAVLFFITALAETSRPPFDLPEAEGELVAGYNVEYSAITFTLFFIAEYSNIILISSIIVICFFGGWFALPGFINPVFTLLLTPLYFIPTLLIYEKFSDLELLAPLVFGIKLNLVIIGFLWVRAAFPRYRYDQLMRLGWKICLPLSLGTLCLTSGILVAFGALP
jgi:NADH-quinone oxidoreductase subunit H